MKTLSFFILAILTASLSFGQTSTDLMLRGMDKMIDNSQESNDAAIADFDKSIALDSTNMLSVHWRGRAKFQNGDYEEAMKDFNHAIRLDSTFSDCYFYRGVEGILQ